MKCKHTTGFLEKKKKLKLSLKHSFLNTQEDFNFRKLLSRHRSPGSTDSIIWVILQEQAISLSKWVHLKDFQNNYGLFSIKTKLKFPLKEQKM